jgi:hypothetical protein
MACVQRYVYVRSSEPGQGIPGGRIGTTVASAAVDDHALFREGLASLFAYEADFEVLGQAGDGDSALTLVRAATATFWSVLGGRSCTE